MRRMPATSVARAAPEQPSDLVFIFQLVRIFLGTVERSSGMPPRCPEGFRHIGARGKCALQNAFAYTLSGISRARALPPERLSL